MLKGECMFVRYSDRTIKEIEYADSTISKFEKPEDQPVWRKWLKEREFEGWRLVSEYTLNASSSVHATLERQIYK